MSVLVDTSVWVDHFKRGNVQLVEVLLRDDAITHPMIIGELACGTPPDPREQTLGDIALLNHATEASPEEVLGFIEREHLYDLGCGLIDLTLLASTLISPGAQLWTLDRRLSQLAQRFEVAFSR